MIRAALLCVLSLGSWPVAAAPREDHRHWLMPELHTSGVLLGTRLGASFLWPEAYDIRRLERNAETFRGAWSTAPSFDRGAAAFEWDGDPWALNLVGHGVLGSEIYLCHRRGHHAWWVSLTFTIAWTAIWEYLVEGWHKQPSGIDLLWTPTGGALFGEGRYQLLQLARRIERPALRHITFYLVDPLGQLERDLLDLGE